MFDFALFAQSTALSTNRTKSDSMYDLSSLGSQNRRHNTNNRQIFTNAVQWFLRTKSYIRLVSRQMALAHAFDFRHSTRFTDSISRAVLLINQRSTITAVARSLLQLREGVLRLRGLLLARNRTTRNPTTPFSRSHFKQFPLLQLRFRLVRVRALYIIAVLSAVSLSGCHPTVYVPKFGFDRLALDLRPADPVFSGPGSSGPIWAPPEVVNVGNCRPQNSCDPCSGGCSQPSHPLQPIDPFGWLRAGTAGSQFIDPVGWVFGL